MTIKPEDSSKKAKKAATLSNKNFQKTTESSKKMLAVTKITDEIQKPERVTEKPSYSLEGPIVKLLKGHNQVIEPIGGTSAKLLRGLNRVNEPIGGTSAKLMKGHNRVIEPIGGLSAELMKGQKISNSMLNSLKFSAKIMNDSNPMQTSLEISTKLIKNAHPMHKEFSSLSTNFLETFQDNQKTFNNIIPKSMLSKEMSKTIKGLQQMTLSLNKKFQFSIPPQSQLSLINPATQALIAGITSNLSHSSVERMIGLQKNEFFIESLRDTFSKQQGEPLTLEAIFSLADKLPVQEDSLQVTKAESLQDEILLTSVIQELYPKKDLSTPSLGWFKKLFSKKIEIITLVLMFLDFGFNRYEAYQTSEQSSKQHQEMLDVHKKDSEQRTQETKQITESNDITNQKLDRLSKQLDELIEIEKNRPPQ